LLASDPRTAALVALDAAKWCRTLLSTCANDRLLAASAAWPLTRWMWRRLERLVQPGIIAHYWHRKHWIEKCCRTAIANGTQRVVVAGAGFDTLALRLATQFPQVEFVEIDHPATQRDKRAALARNGNGPAAGGNLSFISSDFGIEPVPVSRFDDGTTSLLIMEGLLMYLTPQKVDQLFAALGQFGFPIQVLFSFMTQWDDGSCGFRPRSRWVERWLASRDETFTWSIRSATLESYLRNFGLLIEQRATTQGLAALQGSSNLNLEGEELVLCRN
jgi:methyltransferase (TIGR00027 family)